MNFIKGMVCGTLMSAGVMIIMADKMGNKQWKKTGKQLMKKVEKMMN